MSSKRDYYEVLSVSKEASGDELRKAYKREALKHHPDRNQGDAQAEAMFKEASEAYQVLSDDQKRQVYDRFGHAGLESGGPGGFDGIGDVFAHMQDLFSEMFSGSMGFGGNARPRRGADLRIQQRLTLREAAFGCKREVGVHAPTACTDCGGSGGKAGTKPETCTQCRGVGQVSNARGFVMFTSTCSRCRGAGRIIKQACPTCAGQGAVERSPGRRERRPETSTSRSTSRATSASSATARTSSRASTSPSPTPRSARRPSSPPSSPRAPTPRSLSPSRRVRSPEPSSR